MSQVEDRGLPPDDTDARLEQAADWFLRVRSESACVENLPEFKRWIEIDHRNALAYQQVSASWSSIGLHASAPEIVIERRDAMDDARRAAQHRWGPALAALEKTGGASNDAGEASSNRPKRAMLALAASVLIAVASGLVWHSQRGVYATDIGERRALTLQDGSVVTLDARSRIRVDYQESERLIALEQGQVRFDVAKDSARPFRVRAGAQTIVALGTQFNVELIASTVLVTMIEGHVAVAGVTDISPSDGSSSASGTFSSTAERKSAVEEASSSGQVSAQRARGVPPKRKREAGQAPTIELRTGEGLRVRADGQAVVVPRVDIDRATAWQSGIMFFDNEPLLSAAERVNRYSRLQIEVDPSVANVGISGVFNAGDANAFIEAVSSYFQVEINRTSASEIRLSARH